MTVNNSANKTIVAGNGAQTQFAFSFIGVAAAYIGVILTDSGGNETVLTQGAGATQYQLALNQPVAGALWGVGGTVTYNPSGTPIPAGSTLTIFRTLPLTQAISLQNQISLSSLGDGAETGLDTLEMQLQQVFETIARSFTVPLSDPSAPLPVPPVAQRANMGAAFDGSGNLVAGALPASGFISTAMQPVVNAATLALGRAAFGLAAMAQEGIGAGLQDDGAVNPNGHGNARVNFLTIADATNQTVDATFHTTQRIATGPVNYALPRANTVWNGFGFWVFSVSGTVNLVPESHDAVQGLSSGVTLTLGAGTWNEIVTDAAVSGTWYVKRSYASTAGLPTSRVFQGAQSGNYTPRPGVRQIRVRMVAGGGCSGGGSADGPAGAATVFNGVTANPGGGGGKSFSTGGGFSGVGGGIGLTSTETVRRFAGQSGDAGSDLGISTVRISGARGGSSALFGGGAPAGISGSIGAAPTAFSGGGGGGFSAASSNGGSGAGGAGESIDLIVNNPGVIAFVVGAGGSNTGIANGVSGAAGQIIIDEYY